MHFPGILADIADAAQAICDRLTMGVAGLRVDLPIGGARGIGRARAEAIRLIEAGKSEREIVLATGYTGRGIRMLRARLAARDDRQLPLL